MGMQMNTMGMGMQMNAMGGMGSIGMGMPMGGMGMPMGGMGMQMGTIGMPAMQMNGGYGSFTSMGGGSMAPQVTSTQSSASSAPKDVFASLNF